LGESNGFTVRKGLTKDILTTEDVTKSFGNLVAVNKASIALKEGTLTILIGPNGSGKSTLMNVISGYYAPDSGHVILNGNDMTGRHPHELYAKGLVRTFQIPSVFKRLTVLENLLAAARSQKGEHIFVAPFRGLWVSQEDELVEKAFKILELLDMIPLWEKRADKLSGGQLKLVEAGRALMSDPKIILMDEPAGSVSPKVAHQIFAYLLKTRKEFGLTFLIVEHRLDIALSYVDHAYAMHLGYIIDSGTPSQVVASPKVIESYLGG
jgi:branched-chain amino acid transport system ATP-binding protein